MSHTREISFAAAMALGLSVSASAFAAPIVFSIGGTASLASIQTTVDAFRAALGDPNNGNAAGPLAAGRREINWDGGGGVVATTPPATPFNVFLNTRGAQFTTPGTGLSQATPDGIGVLVGNPTYATTFGTFSPERLFVPVGSNITDGLLFIAGTAGATPAGVPGFGAVFTDVDLADTTTIEFFDAGGNLLFETSASPGTVDDASLSFLGVLFDAGELIARVRITTGTNALGPNDDPANGVDVVAMDDFIYGEPVLLSVPAAGGVALFALGAAWLLGRRRARHRDPRPLASPGSA